MAANLGVTVRDITTEVLSLLGVYAPGEPINAADSQTVLFTLGALLDGWGAEPLTIFQINILSGFATTAGKQTYTIGPAATPSPDWVTATLPTTFANVGQNLTNPTATGPLEIPLFRYTDDEWAAISLKTLQNSILAGVWVQYGAASHALSFWPLPSATIPIVLYVAQQVPKLTTLDQVLALPPGYQEAITYELALKCAAKFRAPIPDFLPAAFSDAKHRIMAANFEPTFIDCDPALTVGRGRGRMSGSLDFYLGK